MLGFDIMAFEAFMRIQEQMPVWVLPDWIFMG